MSRILAHVEVRQDYYSRIVIKVEDGIFRLVNAAGVDVDACALPLIINELKEKYPDFKEEWAEAEHYNKSERERPYRLMRRVGMSGCVDLKVRIKIDGELMITSDVGKIHISMYGKLNEDLRLPVVDLVLLLDRFSEDFEGRTDYEIRIIDEEKLKANWGDDWIYPQP